MMGIHRGSVHIWFVIFVQSIFMPIIKEFITKNQFIYKLLSRHFGGSGGFTMQQYAQVAWLELNNLMYYQRVEGGNNFISMQK